MYGMVIAAKTSAPLRIAMAQETEIKLALYPQDLPRLLAHPLLQGGGSAGPARLLNTYFDNPALDLRSARMAVRECGVPRRPRPRRAARGHRRGVVAIGTRKPLDIQRSATKCMAPSCNR